MTILDIKPIENSYSVVLEIGNGTYPLSLEELENLSDLCNFYIQKAIIAEHKKVKQKLGL